MTPRDAATRKADTLAQLTAPAADVWVATAGAAGPYLVPLSLAWHGERVVLALETRSVTARNLKATSTARLAVGATRDVVMIDAIVQDTLDVAAADELGDAYAAQSDWDPRAAGEGYVFVVLRPLRIQAWREVDEIDGRTLMRDGRWLV